MVSIGDDSMTIAIIAHDKKKQKMIDLCNEYKENINIDEFWDLVESNKDKLDNKEFYKDSDNLPFILMAEHVPHELKDKYDVECYEFYSDGLRFSSTTEFS